VKVLHVIPSLGPARGGPSHALPVLAEELVRQGVHVDMCATDDNADARLRVPLCQPITVNGVTIWFFPRQTRFYAFSAPLTAWLTRHIAQYDLVHIHALFSYATLPAAVVAARRGVPYIVRPLGTLNRYGMRHRRPHLKRASFRLVESRILSGAAALHFTSEDERQQAREIGVDGPSAVIPPGVDVSQFDHLPPAQLFLDAYPRLSGRRIVLFLSRLDPKKGLDVLLPAFGMLRMRYPTAALVLAGSGDVTFEANLRRQAERLDLTDHIAFVGFLDGSAKRAAFSAASAFVLPSYSENFGIACAEALAAGLPVVISRHVGVAPDVERYGAGLVVEAQEDSVCEALAHLLEDPVAHALMALRARALAFEQYSLQSTVWRLRELYSQILERPNLPAHVGGRATPGTSDT